MRAETRDTGLSVSGHPLGDRWTCGTEHQSPKILVDKPAARRCKVETLFLSQSFQQLCPVAGRRLPTREEVVRESSEGEHVQRQAVGVGRPSVLGGGLIDVFDRRTGLVGRSEHGR